MKGSALDSQSICWLLMGHGKGDGEDIGLVSSLKDRVVIQRRRNRRKYPREPVSFLVKCRQADLTRVGGKALNWSPQGIAIKTNCPICVGEQLTVEFVEPKTFNAYKVQGQVVWRLFHGDSSVQAEALFTAGIKFLSLKDSFETDLP